MKMHENAILAKSNRTNKTALSHVDLTVPIAVGVRECQLDELDGRLWAVSLLWRGLHRDTSSVYHYSLKEGCPSLFFPANNCIILVIPYKNLEIPKEIPMFT